MPLEIGQGSGDFRETSGRVQILHAGKRNSVGVLSPDAFTQANPPIVTTTANVSTTLTGISKVGVLGATVAFTRPDVANSVHGGPVQAAGPAYVDYLLPLGIFINDAIGNAYENTPGVASNRGPYLSGQGTLAVSLWETQIQIGASTALTYAAGDKLYASVNGLLTNRVEDAYEYQTGGASAGVALGVTVIGVVKIAPDANNSLLVFDLRL
jgi:hypothetical protein